jgi:hypothetical protein
MSVHRSVTAALFVAVITALLFVALAYSPTISKADAQTGKAERAAKADSVTKADLIAKATPTERAAAPCGFSRWRQTWRNCTSYRYRVYGTWYEGATGDTGYFGFCARPGTTYLYRVVPFGTLAVQAYKGRRC